MKKKIFIMLGLIAFIMLLIPNTYALSLTEVGESVSQEGEYDSVRLIAGNNVRSSAKINGISFVAGNSVTVNGNSQYGFYAGNVLTIRENIEKDAFIAGSSIVIGNEAVIGRDLFVAGDMVTVEANVARNLYVGGSTVDISGITINGDAYIDADKIIMTDDTIIVGTLNYIEKAKITGLNENNIGSIKTHKISQVRAEVNFKDHLYSFLFSAIGAFIVMVVLFYVNPKAKEKLDDIKWNGAKMAKTCGVGALLLLITPITAVLALFTGVLTPLAFIAFVIYCVGIYFATLLTGYVIGRLLNEKVFKMDNVYLALVIGILLVRLITYIPYIGGLLFAICLAYGMGLIYRYIRSFRK